MHAKLCIRPKRRAQTDGYAVIAILTLLGVIAATLAVMSLNAMALKSERDRKTTSALAQATQALISRAAADANHPGSLPCPDINNDGALTMGVDYGGGGVCTSYLGRLPWRTLGLSDLRDADGERLWYALSQNFRDTGGNTVNSNTTGTLSVTGTFTASNAAAIVFAPGSLLSGQLRDAANQNNAANYLDGNNALGGPVFQNLAASPAFNDRLIAIPVADLMARVNKRVVNEVALALNAFAAAYGALPSAANPNASNCRPGGNPNLCAVNQPSGILAPAGSGAYAPANFITIGAWFNNNLWQPLVGYTLTCKTAPTGCVAGQFTLALPNG